MYSYNHAQRAVAGGKYGCSKAAAPVFKKASIALDLITSASRALTVPSNGVPGIWCFKLRTHQDLSFVLVAWLLQQGMKATQEAQDLKAKLPAPTSCQAAAPCPAPQEQAAGADCKPAAASAPAMVCIYVEAGYSTRCSSDSAYGTASCPAVQQQVAVQDDTAADAHCHSSRKQQQRMAAAAKGKLQQCSADSDTVMQQEANVPEVAAAAAAAAVMDGQQAAGVSKPSWLQRALTKLLLGCGGASLGEMVGL